MNERMPRLPYLQRQLFSVSEAEYMTGRSPQSQRHDRRLGFAEPLEGGKARYSVVELSEMLILQTLVSRGIRAEDAAGIAHDSRQQVAWWALLEPNKIVDPTTDLESLCQKLNVEPVVFVIQGPTGKFDCFRFCIIWQNGRRIFCDEIDKSLDGDYSVHDAFYGFDRSSSDATTAGALILLDLKALGRLLASRTQRPFIVAGERAK